MNTYRKGRRAEKLVAEKMKRSGKFKYVKLSKGSRGPADIRARSIYGPKVQIQVKSGSARMNSEEKRKLIAMAKKNKAVAIYTKYDKGKFKNKQLGNFSRLKKHRIRV
jgi:predicted Mrr-cat superfamily restriction endonuclease